MIYKEFFHAPCEYDRNFDIIYRLGIKEDCFFIESAIEGGLYEASVCLGSCFEDKAEEICILLAKNSVRPIHIEDIISDIII